MMRTFEFPPSALDSSRVSLLFLNVSGFLPSLSFIIQLTGAAGRGIGEGKYGGGEGRGVKRFVTRGHNCITTTTDIAPATTHYTAFYSSGVPSQGHQRLVDHRAFAESFPGRVRLFRPFRSGQVDKVQLSHTYRLVVAPAFDYFPLGKGYGCQQISTTVPLW